MQDKPTRFALRSESDHVVFLTAKYKQDQFQSL
jgi:hypothetical protein